MNMFAPNPIKIDEIPIVLVPYCSLWIAGKPRATPRIQAFRRGKHIGTTTPSTADDWKALVAIASTPLLPGTPIVGPIVCNLTLVFPRPQRLNRKRDFKGPVPMDHKPDRDNCEKAISDMLTDIGMWRDDNQIFDGRLSMWYHAINGQPGAHIEIFTVNLDALNAAGKQYNHQYEQGPR